MMAITLQKFVAFAELIGGLGSSCLRAVMAWRVSACQDVVRWVSHRPPVVDRLERDDIGEGLVRSVKEDVATRQQSNLRKETRALKSLRDKQI
jgi:hypothetical protein